MIKTTIIGNVVRDLELKKVLEDKTVCVFTVASNRIGAKEGSQSVDFLNVEVWGKMAENCAEYLKKGSGVAVSGDLHIDNYVKDDETRYSVKLVNCDVQFLAKPNGEKSEDKSEKE